MEEAVGVDETDHPGSGMYCLPLRIISSSELVEEGDGKEDPAGGTAVMATCAEDEGGVEAGGGQGFRVQYAAHASSCMQPAILPLVDMQKSTEWPSFLQFEQICLSHGQDWAAKAV